MATKSYVVRAGFNYRLRDDKGNEKVYSEGDTITLDQEIGDTAHQLEYSEDKDRREALRVENAAKRSGPSAEVQG